MSAALYERMVPRRDGESDADYITRLGEKLDDACSLIGRVSQALWGELGYLASEEPEIPRGDGQEEALLKRAAGIIDHYRAPEFRDGARDRLTVYIQSVMDGTNPAGDGTVHRSEILDAVLRYDLK